MLKRKKLLHLSDEELLRLLYRMHHRDKMSMLAMSKELGVSRDALTRWMVYFDIPFRNGSEANKIRFSRMTSEERKKVTKNANQASRGRKHSIEEKLRRASLVSSRATMSEHEKTFAKLLIDHDLYDFIFSYPVNIFNIDFAFPVHKVAVEVDGGNWHTTPTKLEQDINKEKYLESEGWSLLRWSNLYSDDSTLALIALLKTALKG